MTQKAYELGVVEVEIDGFKVKVYDLEKSVCDAIKYRNKIGLDVSSEISNNYLSRKERDIIRLYEYASRLRVGKKIDELIKFILYPANRLRNGCFIAYPSATTVSVLS